MKFIIAISIISTFILGCQGCLSFSGTYKEYSGSVKWCPDHEETAKVGQPVVTNEYGEKSVILSPDEILIVNEVLATKVEPVQIKNTEKAPPYLELIRLVGKLKK